MSYHSYRPSLLPKAFRRARSSVHAFHAAAVAAACGGCLLGLGNFRDHCFGRQHEAGDRGCVLQCGPGDLGRIDNTGGYEIFELVRSGVVAVVVVLALVDLADDHRTFDTGIANDLAKRLFDGATNDLGADLLITLEGSDQFFDILGAAQQGNAAARDDAFFHGSAGCMHRVFNAGLLFLHLGFGCSSDLDDGDAANQLRKTLLELLAIVVRGGLFDLVTDFLHTTFDDVSFALAFNDGGVVLVNGDALRTAEVFELHVLELDAEIFRDGLAASQLRDVFEHGLAAIAEARGLHGRDIQRATQLVHDQGRECFAVYIFSNDDEGLRVAGNLLEQRKQILHGRDLLLVDQDVGIFDVKLPCGPDR